MPIAKRQLLFFSTPEGIEAEQMLRKMDEDASYDTSPSYSTNDAYPDHMIPFVDKHMKYLSMHPGTNPKHYISNLRLMTRIGHS